MVLSTSSNYSSKPKGFARRFGPFNAATQSQSKGVLPKHRLLTIGINSYCKSAPQGVEIRHPIEDRPGNGIEVTQ